MIHEHRVSIKRACKAAGLSRAAFYRSPSSALERDGEVIEALNGIVERNNRWGFWKCFDRLRLNGQTWNHKRVWHVYCEMGLNLPRRTKKRIPHREPIALDAGTSINQGPLTGPRPGQRAALGMQTRLVSFKVRAMPETKPIPYPNLTASTCCTR